MASEEVPEGSTGSAPNPEDGESHRCTVVHHDTLAHRLYVEWTDLKAATGTKVHTWIARNDFKPDARPPAD